MAWAFTFPGQGSQAVGMGKALSEAFDSAREVFEEVDDALSQRLTAIMWEGPEDELKLTANTQPALFAHSLAAFRVLTRELGVDPKAASFYAGHSLGEYSALAASGALSVAQGAKLLRIRGEAMQKAVAVGDGAMMTPLGLGLEDVEAIVHDAKSVGVIAIANDNVIGQTVVSGDVQAVEKAGELAKAKGAKKVVMLPVSAPFHCPLMQPAADVMKKALTGVHFNPPAAPIVANVTAKAESDPVKFHELLHLQVTGKVRWRESVEHMAGAGVTGFAEIGTGKVLTTMAKRIAPDAKGMAAGDPESLEALARELLGN